MKKLLITIGLIFICGCQVGFPFHTAAWYQTGKTIEQARKDSDECLSECYNTSFAYRDCMKERGYKMKPTGWLRDRNILIQEDFWTSKDVADGTKVYDGN